MAGEETLKEERWKRLLQISIAKGERGEREGNFYFYFFFFSFLFFSFLMLPWLER